jgi:hypothetical protein
MFYLTFALNHDCFVLRTKGVLEKVFSGCINFLNRKVFDFSIQKIYATHLVFFITLSAN